MHQKIVKEVEADFTKFEKQFDKLLKKVAKIARNNLDYEINLFKKVKLDKKRIVNLKEELSVKKTYSDVKVDGLENIEDEIKKREKRLKKDEFNLFFGNPFLHSGISFEKKMLKKIETESVNLHLISTNIQQRIKNFFDFNEEEIKAKINKHDLHKKQVSLIGSNLQLHTLLHLSNLPINSIEELQEYNLQKASTLSKIDLDKHMENPVENLKAHYFSELNRTNALTSLKEN